MTDEEMLDGLCSPVKGKFHRELEVGKYDFKKVLLRLGERDDLTAEQKRVIRMYKMQEGLI